MEIVCIRVGVFDCCNSLNTLMRSDEGDGCGCRGGGSRQERLQERKGVSEWRAQGIEDFIDTNMTVTA